MEELRKAIIQKLKLHTELNTLGVRVDVDGDHIVLSGLVDGEDAKATVAGLASTFGEDVVILNRLEIRKENISGNQGYTKT